MIGPPLAKRITTDIRAKSGERTNSKPNDPTTSIVRLAARCSVVALDRPFTRATATSGAGNWGAGYAEDDLPCTIGGTANHFRIHRSSCHNATPFAVTRRDKRTIPLGQPRERTC